MILKMTFLIWMIKHKKMQIKCSPKQLTLSLVLEDYEILRKIKLKLFKMKNNQKLKFRKKI